MKATREPMAVVLVAMIIGWYLRVGIERWPVWQPIISMAGLAVSAYLTAWLERTVRCDRLHALDMGTWTCLRAHVEPAEQPQDGLGGTGA